MRSNTPEQVTQIQKQLEKEITQLPLLPTAVAQLMGLSISDPNYFEKVQTLAEQDPTFAVRLIRLANAAANAPISQITSIHHAVARIGTRHIKGLITSFAVAQIFIPRNKSECNLWVHSIQVAVAAQSIARMAASYGIEPEQAYLCGLLHDIGRFIMFKTIPSGPVRIDEHDWNSPEDLVMAEQEACGLTHVQVGAMACRKWALPEYLGVVIEHHHSYNYDELTVTERKLSNLVKVVQMADSFSILIMKQPEVLELAPAALEEIIAEKCVHASWEEPPIRPVLLQNEAAKIADKAADIINGLGICTLDFE